MPRFVVLFHECPPSYPRASHWDLMLEEHGQLRTWALSKLPDRAVETTVEAEQLADHRIEYLDYEGAISGGRGTVTRWDRGTYRLLSEGQEPFAIQLAGEKFIGQLTLTQSDTSSNHWSLRFKHEPK